MTYLNCQFCGVIVERKNPYLTPTCFTCRDTMGKVRRLKKKIPEIKQRLKKKMTPHNRVKLEGLLTAYEVQLLTLSKELGILSKY